MDRRRDAPAARRDRRTSFPRASAPRWIEGFNDPNDETGNGIVDFVRELKKEYPPAAAGLLARILATVNTEDGGCSGSNVVVNICSIPSGKFLTDAPVALQKEAKLHLVADNVFELDEDGELIVDADNVVDLRPAPVADAADTFDVDHIENDADGDKDGAFSSGRGTLARTGAADRGQRWCPEWRASAEGTAASASRPN